MRDLHAVTRFGERCLAGELRVALRLQRDFDRLRSGGRGCLGGLRFGRRFGGRCRGRSFGRDGRFGRGRSLRRGLRAAASRQTEKSATESSDNLESLHPRLHL